MGAGESKTLLGATYDVHQFKNEQADHARETPQTSDASVSRTGRPPRNSKSKPSKRNFDSYRNERFPKELIARIKKVDKDRVAEIKPWTNKSFRSLLGVEPLDDDDEVLITSLNEEEAGTPVGLGNNDKEAGALSSAGEVTLRKSSCFVCACWHNSSHPLTFLIFFFQNFAYESTHFF